MHIVNIDGLVVPDRRYRSGGSSVHDEDVKDPVKLAEMLRHLSRRVTEIEARVPPEGMEFEVDVGAGGASVALQHNYRSQVRFYVTLWVKQRGGAAPVAGHSLVLDESLTTTTTLVLKSYVSGRAVIRLEPVFTGVTYND